jgi:hypothetical protein
MAAISVAISSGLSGSGGSSTRTTSVASQEGEPSSGVSRSPLSHASVIRGSCAKASASCSSIRSSGGSGGVITSERMRRAGTTQDHIHGVSVVFASARECPLNGGAPICRLRGGVPCSVPWELRKARGSGPPKPPAPPKPPKPPSPPKPPKPPRPPKPPAPPGMEYYWRD